MRPIFPGSHRCRRDVKYLLRRSSGKPFSRSSAAAGAIQYDESMSPLLQIVRCFQTIVQKVDAARFGFVCSADVLPPLSFPIVLLEYTSEYFPVGSIGHAGSFSLQFDHCYSFTAVF
jgi:hypothetical protein